MGTMNVTQKVLNNLTKPLTSRFNNRLKCLESDMVNQNQFVNFIFIQVSQSTEHVMHTIKLI